MVFKLGRGRAALAPFPTCELTHVPLPSDLPIFQSSKYSPSLDVSNIHPMPTSGGEAVTLTLQLQDAHEGDQILLFLGSQIQLQDEIEELDRIFEREQPAVVQIRR